jgi:hypothetical protein
MFIFGDFGSLRNNGKRDLSNRKEVTEGILRNLDANQKTNITAGDLANLFAEGVAELNEVMNNLRDKDLIGEYGVKKENLSGNEKETVTSLLKLQVIAGKLLITIDLMEKHTSIVVPESIKNLLNSVQKRIQDY